MSQRQLIGEAFAGVAVEPLPPLPSTDTYYQYIYAAVARILVRKAALGHAETLYMMLLMFDDILRPMGVPTIKFITSKSTLNAYYRHERMQIIVRAGHRRAVLIILLDGRQVMQYTTTKRKMRKM